MTDVQQNVHVRAFLIALVLLNLLGVLVMTHLGGWALLPALLWVLIVPLVLAKQQRAEHFGKCALQLYGKFLLWGIASLLVFMIGGALILLGVEYLGGIINRGP